MQRPLALAEIISSLAKAGFASLLGIVGFGMLIGGVTGYRRARALSALAAAHPQIPWAWRPDWAAGRIRSPIGVNLVEATIAVVVGMGLVIAPWVIWSGRPFLPPLLCFSAIGLLVFALGAYQIDYRRQFGRSEFQMARVPGVIGGQLTGAIQITARVSPPDGFTILLECKRQIVIRDGRRRRTFLEKTLWSSERTVMGGLLEDQPELTFIPVEFRIPDNLPCSDREIISWSKREIMWRLTVKATMPGTFNYTANFTVPVFTIAHAGANLAIDGASTEADRLLERQMRETGIFKTAIPGGEGVRFSFPIVRKLNVAVLLTILCPVVGASLVASGTAAHPERILTVLPVVFGTIFAILAAIVTYLGYTRVIVDLSPQEVAIRGGRLLPGRTLRIRTFDIESFETRQRISLGSCESFNLYVVRTDGTQIVIAKRLPGFRLAGSVARQMEQALLRRSARG